ncbi:type II toxin-antitoxin system RelE/ParE family toxin [Gymnodinialimonas mytili]|uniref:type II toxin-antitoxin system RelE/ParE family toxin n=1 Tax=Gymnodinialimonas mytili TaxID=3126503 RepID=UPI003F71AF61
MAGQEACSLVKAVILLPDAEDDLDRIYDYTAESRGLARAVKYNRQLRSRIKGLASGRTASRKADSIRPGLRRALAGSHVVFFRGNDAAMMVVRGM